MGDATRALEVDPPVVIISGGSDVLIRIRGGKFAGCFLVGIHGIPEFEGVRMEEDGTIVTGPTTIFSHMTSNDIIMKHIPILGDAIDQVSDPQLRSIGTVGGNVRSDVTSTDSASNFCVLDAILVLGKPKGTREVLIREWYTGPGRTAREHEEVLTAIEIRRESCEGFGGHYIKYSKRNAMEIATSGYAVAVKLSDDRRHAEEMHLGYGVVVPTPTRCPEMEEEVKGMETGEALYEIVGKGVLEEVNPRSSWKASEGFRLRLVEELGKCALKQTIISTGGEADA